jgi:pimeloyl-ACP methyl ester carboxylesterase
MRFVWIAAWMLPVVLGFCAAQAQITPAAEAGAGAGARSGHVDVEGGRLFYEELGAGRAIVLLHDGLLHRETWDAQFPVLAAQYRVVRYDRRGYGRSTEAQAPFSDIRDLDAVLTALGIEDAAVIGCSSGGQLAIDYTLAHPERVSALVLVGAIVSGMGFTEHFATRGGRFHPTPATTLDEVIEYFSNVDPYAIAPANRAAKERANALFKANPQNLNWARGRLVEPAARPALHALGEIAVPTLILVGEYDIPDVHAHCGAIEAGIAGAKRIVVSDAAHLVHMEQPAVFNELVLSFLAARPADGPLTHE